MTLSEFSELVIEGVTGFRCSWRENQQKFPADYLAEMEEGDWWEQFEIWLLQAQEGGGDDTF